jgi:DNA polymerase V
MPEIIREHGVQVYSSNYTLYGHMSAKMMATLSELTPRVEVFSIDEAFADLTDLPIDDLSEFADTVKQKMYRDTGLPVRVSIAPTRCLTKIGCELLKGSPYYSGRNIR